MARKKPGGRKGKSVPKRRPVSRAKVKKPAPKSHGNFTGFRPTAAQKQRIKKARRSIGANINYQYWIQGFADRIASETGTRPSVTQVIRNPRFQRAADVVLASNLKTRSKSNSSALARALVELGMRDPSFRGSVGTSPGTGGTYSPKRGPRRVEYVSPSGHVVRRAA